MTEMTTPHDEEMRGMSCYTTTPQRMLEVIEEERGRCPVAHSDEHDGYHLLYNYADVRSAMADHELYSSQPQVLRPMLPRKPIPALDMDPPQHQHWRVLFNQAVTPRSVRALEAAVRQDVTEHIDAFIAKGHAEIVADLAEAVPANTICRLVGLDPPLVPIVRDLALEMFAAMGEPEEFGRRQAAFGAVTVAEVHKRRAEPRDDYLTYLAGVEVDGKALDDDDYVVLLAAFLGAGHHSTTSAITSLVHEVFGNPAVRDRLLADPTLLPVAAEEALRLRPPFFGFFRRATRDTEVAGCPISAGDDVYMSWAAANRDAQQFPDPASFSLDRGRNRHLSFGFGIHTCPGAPLARMEMIVALEELLRRTPDLTVGIENPPMVFGGGDYAFIEALPVTFSPGVPEGSGPSA